MKSKSIFALGLVLLSGHAFAGKKKNTRTTTPPGIEREESPIPPGFHFTMRLKILENDIGQLDRRSPFGMPGSLRDFYTDKFERCGNVLIAIMGFQQQVRDSDLSEADKKSLINCSVELHKAVITISNNAQIARNQCKMNPYMELSSLMLEE